MKPSLTLRSFKIYIYMQKTMVEKGRELFVRL